MDILKNTWTRTWDASLKFQGKAEAKLKNIGHGRWGRVLRMSRKPTSEEYSKTLIVTGLGIVLIGGLGFCIYLLWEYMPEMNDWTFGL